jgi:glycosyltransferase involved in cell wall biosynthesis
MTPRRVTIVASELLGRSGTGGAGTADSLLAVALARHGHAVELLIASGREIGVLSEKWTKVYADADVGVRVLDQIAGVRPAYLRPTFEVYRALRDDPPDVAIVDDWRGLGFAALRARQAGIALQETAFVVNCHGPGRVLTTFAQKVPDTLERFGEQITERASFELADGVVSPTQWLLGWLRDHRWPVPASARVIPYVREAVVLGEASEPIVPDGAVRRLAFFGQLREGKGIRLFVDSLDALDPQLIEGKEIVFLGSARGRWAADRIAAAVTTRVKEHVTALRFETNLERDAALAELRQPGTLAVMPSLLDNAPNTVSECIELGVPFIATATGGIPELVADEDRPRVLCEPTSEALTSKLTEALSSAEPFAPARAAHDDSDSVGAWLEVVESARPTPGAATRRAGHVVVVTTTETPAERARQLAKETTSANVEVVHGATRREGLLRTSAEWVVFLDDDDGPQPKMLETLLAAQAASGADVVTSAVTPIDDENGIQLFLGDAGALGLVENQYGVVGLVRRSLAVAAELQDGGVDPDWPLFARLALNGARIVSLPEALATHAGIPGRVTDVPGEGLQVLETFEQAPTPVDGLPQLAATLASALTRQANERPAQAARPRSLLRRLVTLARR